MKTKDIVVYSIIFFVFALFTADIVVRQLSGRHLFDRTDAPVYQVKATACSSKPQTARPVSDDPQLKAVAEYDKVCGSSVITQMMLFTNMPSSEETAQTAADAMAARLKKFSGYGVQPIVIAEPDSELGLIDFSEFARGDYDRWIDLYFDRLKANGVTDSQMGVWIPFPEPQQPFWNNNANPDDFAHSVNRYFASLRKRFPTAKTAILLDSQVGADEASQLVAYTRLITPGLVNMAGLQGFPWHPSDPNDKRKPLESASKFAPAYMLEEVAQSLGVREVLLNTGTYRHRRMENGGDMAVTTAQRQTTLRSIVTEASLLKNAGYKVTVNLFAEDKLEVKEGVDWSYWDAGTDTNKVPAHAPLFTQFVRELLGSGVELSLYDSRQK